MINSEKVVGVAQDGHVLKSRPAEPHPGGGIDTVAFGVVPTQVGDVLVAVTESGVAATHFRDSPAVRARIVARIGLAVVEDRARTDLVRTELAAYFTGSLRAFTVPLDWRLMSASQRLVLGSLYETVHFGQVVTYGELARRCGSTIPARGIGSIMASNPIPILVPCHRVVAGNGLGGFSGGDGVESKQALLALEGQLPAGLW
ncbi:MAG: methylated-DNA--[protein]-cysteine S-methyltransferase [Geodermatophilaceae bacterium]|nr:methylated-DNA--[protein]-cysteine S-methyltransferase [Geodermatophilaceae bacterium]